MLGWRSELGTNKPVNARFWPWLEPFLVRAFLHPLKVFPLRSRKIDVRLPGKGNSNSHGARPVHLIITMVVNSDQ